MYLKNAIDQLEREKSVHAEKFAANPVHANCLPNFDQAIGKLKQELEKMGVELKP
jgi:hypothetical protein